ncbi:cation diffusion facilitator family transporter [Cohnella sp. REN36]|uniref:cation diffusion facilitator family transporter n=1 Tax=Cohnella sp. REN36 TaxID=2887347 RepID=UPI001D1418F2|nr:cation diffusion facilitator family transporter [Cohnella sp. REN36]MCC3371673.1 cation diffusion facilitator family transporter [Cohnella sp. REN36]
MEAANRQLKQGEKGIRLSLIAYLLLTALKLTIGYATGSEALSADGFNNATDIVASIAVLIGLRISQKPPDRDHRYGHSRAETVAALIASLIIFGVGVQVFFQSIAKFRSPSLASPELLAAWIALVGAAVMYGVYRYNARLARQIGSSAVRAVAQDNRSDALVSVGAFVGIVGAQFGLPWLDPAAALVVAVVIVKTAWDIFAETTHALTDGFDDERLQRIRQTIRETPGVGRTIDIRARTHGNSVFVDVTIGVDPELSVSDSHAITEQVERRLLDVHRIANVLIHIEPYEAAEDGMHPEAKSE